MKKNNSYILIIIVLCLISLLPVLPFIYFGSKAAFYINDPEMAYIGNALSFIKTHIIHYRDHPGTPVVLLDAFSYWPLRVYAKLIAKESFIEWSFDHLKFLFMYSRWLQVLIYITSTALYLLALKKLSKSKVILIIGWFLLYTFYYFPSFATRVNAESISYLVIATWLLVFSDFYNSVQENPALQGGDELNSDKNRPPFGLFLLSLISGIGVAVKYNNAVLVLVSLALVFTIKHISIKQKVYNFLLNTSFAIGSFILGTWPIRTSYKIMAKGLLKVAASGGSGAAHGVEASQVFSLADYVGLARNMFYAEKYFFIFFFAGIIILLYALKKRRIGLKDPLFVLFFTSSVFLLVLLKYPLNYYLLPSVIIIAFAIAGIIGRLGERWLFLLIIPLFLIAYRNINYNINVFTQSIQKSIFLETYIAENPARKATLWDFGPAQDFLYIWIRDWSHGIFDTELESKRPDLLELKADNKTVNYTYSDSREVFDICWDKLYIRDKRAKEFIDMYPFKDLKPQKIGETDIILIGSSHCVN